MTKLMYKIKLAWYKNRIKSIKLNAAHRAIQIVGVHRLQGKSADEIIERGLTPKKREKLYEYRAKRVKLIAGITDADLPVPGFDPRRDGGKELDEIHADEIEVVPTYYEYDSDGKALGYRETVNKSLD